MKFAVIEWDKFSPPIIFAWKWRLDAILWANNLKPFSYPEGTGGESIEYSTSYGLGIVTEYMNMMWGILNYDTVVRRFKPISYWPADQMKSLFNIFATFSNAYWWLSDPPIK